jgi:nitroreductase/NAD-dependent dihydropyrimidine dehydrogenase PreA subunit
MEIIQIDQKTCVQCGVCAAICPDGLIEFRSSEFPRPAAGADLTCIRCGHCAAVCPKGSLTHRDLPADQFPIIRQDLKISPEQCEQMLRSRRSIREYKKQAVPREVITSLIETARYAPTGHNNQEIEWLVIDNPAELEDIEKIGTEWIRWLIKNQPQIAPGFDLKIMLEKQERDVQLFLRGAPALVVTHAEKNSPIALIDSSIALSYLDLAAASQGLGCCWAGFVYFMANGFPPLIKALDLPRDHSAYGCMMLGYPEFSYHSLPWRKPPAITWHSYNESIK